MRSFTPSFPLRSLLAAAILALSFVLAIDIPGTCVPKTAPNTLAAANPFQTTGVVNGTITVLPISFDLARSIIPAKYAILSGYKALLEPYGFPEDKYPLVLETRIDHDVRYLNIQSPDFSSARLFFPFVDRLGDGKSGFRYASTILLSGSPFAALFSSLYGEPVTVGTFNPTCDAYAVDNGTVHFAVTPYGSTTPAVSIKHSTLPTVGPYPFSFYSTVVGQPWFSNDVTCDWFDIDFSTPYSTGVNAPVGVNGTATIVAPYLPTTTTFDGVYGINVAAPFIEHNYQPCANVGGH